jgi:hypothetical protein
MHIEKLHNMYMWTKLVTMYVDVRHKTSEQFLFSESHTKKGPLGGLGADISAMFQENVACGCAMNSGSPGWHPVAGGTEHGNEL